MLTALQIQGYLFFCAWPTNEHRKLFLQFSISLFPVKNEKKLWDKLFWSVYCPLGLKGKLHILGTVLLRE